MPRWAAISTLRRISAACSSSVLPSCPSQWRREPLQRRLMVRAPARSIQSRLLPLSTKPSTSTRSSRPLLSAHRVMRCTASSSPSLTRAEATSTRSTWSSSSSALHISSFSCGMKLTPLVCSPSRRVVSMISMGDSPPALSGLTSNPSPNGEGNVGEGAECVDCLLSFIKAILDR